MGPFALHIETVGKSGRDPQGGPLLGRERQPDPLAMGRTPGAQVDCHIEDGARHHLYQFALRLLSLIVQPSQRPLPGATQVVLNEAKIAAAPGKDLVAKQLHEVTALVVMTRMDDLYHIRNLQ